MGTAVNATIKPDTSGEEGGGDCLRVDSLLGLFRQLLPYDYPLTELIFRH